MRIGYFLYKKNFFTVVFTVIITIFILNCSYQLNTNVANKKLKKYDNNINVQRLILHSYDPFGAITRAIRTELYNNKINYLDNLTDNLEIQNTCICLYIINTSETHITTSIFSDGTEAGYQLVLHIYTKLLIPHEDYCPINIRVCRTFIRISENALSNDAQENNIRELMYQEAAEKLIFYIVSQYKQFFIKMYYNKNYNFIYKKKNLAYYIYYDMDISRTIIG